MLTQKQLQTAQDYLAAADREFENANAVAGTERLWDAITHTLTAIAEAMGWAHDAGDLFPVVQKLAERDEQVSYILEGIYAVPQKAIPAWFAPSISELRMVIRTGHGGWRGSSLTRFWRWRHNRITPLYAWEAIC